MICTRPFFISWALDHKELTYFHSGRDFRLTDVFGRVLTDIVT